jgi:hypothetical protein
MFPQSSISISPSSFSIVHQLFVCPHIRPQRTPCCFPCGMTINGRKINQMAPGSERWSKCPNKGNITMANPVGMPAPPPRLQANIGMCVILSLSQQRGAPFRALARGEGANSDRLFTSGERKALAKSKVHQ